MSFDSFINSVNFATSQFADAWSGQTALDVWAADREFNTNLLAVQMDYNNQQMLAQQKFDLDMWNLNNEYNSPINQIGRALDAGISPNAVIGRMNPYQSTAPTTKSLGIGLGSAPSTGSALAGGLMSHGANMANAQSNMLNAQANAIESESRKKLNEYQLSWNLMSESERLKELSSNIHKNYADIIKLLSSSGLDNVSAKEIEERTRFISGLSESEINIRKQTLTNMYNNNLATIQGIKESEQRIKESEQGIKESDARIENYQSSTKLNESENMQTIYETNTEEFKTKVAKLEYEFANEMSVPLGTPDFMFYWKLYLDNRLNEFIDNVSHPLERVKWKPADYTTLYQNGVYKRTNYHYDFNSRTGIFNPHPSDKYDAESRYKDFKETQKKRNEFTNKYRLRFIK